MNSLLYFQGDKLAKVEVFKNFGESEVKNPWMKKSIPYSIAMEFQYSIPMELNSGLKISINAGVVVQGYIEYFNLS